jgi:hypothetical protein
MSDLKERAAKALGWSTADANSLSMQGLRAVVHQCANRPDLVAEMDWAIQSGAYIRGTPLKKQRRSHAAIAGADTARIKQIAVAVRRDLEQHGYGGGRCLDASQELAQRLRAAGIEARIVAGKFKMPEARTPSPHWWVEAEGLIVDPTLDQFQIGTDEKLPKVFVGTYADREEYIP